jgi:hypothetical protein
VGDYRNPKHNVYALMVKQGDGRSGIGEMYKPDTGESVTIKSGNRTLFGTPGDRAYLVGDQLPVNKGMTIRERIGKGKKAKTIKAAYNYELIALTEEGERTKITVNKPKEGDQLAVYDPLKKQLAPKEDPWRTLLRIHPDGPPAGSAGCLVTPTVAEANQLQGMLTSNTTVVTVKYFDTQAELDKYKQQLKDAYKKKDTSGASPPSETKQKEVLRNGEKSVRAGVDQRPVAFAQGKCVHSGGVPVRDGSRVVRVGTDQLPMSRETDKCMDNHEIEKTG